jgi:hypothetical protein
MSPHSIKRFDRSLSKWLWMLLALCLIGWRVGSRVEQYRPSIAFGSHQAQITFFDANERNKASLDESRCRSRVVAERTDCLLPVAGLEPPVHPAYRSQWGDRTALPPIYVKSVFLFSNPPPPSLT